MIRLSSLVILMGLSVFTPDRTARAVPPFSGTIFIDPDIITAADPTTYLGIAAAGQGFRWMFDRRINNWAYLNAYLFNASFSDGLATEIQVNPEFGSTGAASTEAAKYGDVIGRLPTALRSDAQTVWIHRGTQPFGGGNNNLLIHVGQADVYAASGILEETLVHEASHTSLDADHAAAAGWLAAQSADGEFISTYARDNSTREDIAESFLPYLAVRYRADRISTSLANTISQTIPNRMSYFDSLSLDMFPIHTPTPGDIDKDSDVDGRDVVLFAQRYGMTSGSVWTTGDFNSDGRTSLADLRLLQLHVTNPAGSVALNVPETSTLYLALGILAVAVTTGGLKAKAKRRAPR